MLPRLNTLLELVFAVYCKAKKFRKTAKMVHLRKVLSTLLQYIHRAARQAPSTLPYALYWEGMVLAMSGSRNRAIEVFRKATKASLPYGQADKLTKYGRLLSAIELARLDGDIGRPQSVQKILRDIVEVGDLHNLELLNKEGIEGAASAYNSLLEDSAFVDLFQVNHLDEDERSKAPSNSYGELNSHSMSSLYALSRKKSVDKDQDLLEIALVGRKSETDSFSGFLQRLQELEEPGGDETGARKSQFAVSFRVGEVFFVMRERQ